MMDDDDYDLLKLFTASCLASGKNADDAVNEAERATYLIKEVRAQQEMDFDDD